ncbi:unnamed protein product, partial [Closterium sp. Naga37s-1]
MPAPRAVDSPPRHSTILTFRCRQSRSAAREPSARSPRSPSAHSPPARSPRRGRVGASTLPRARRAAWLAAVAVAVAVVAMVSPATAGRPNVLDNFLPPCPTLAEPTTHKKWSDLATWAPGPIPGQGDAIGANVTIACGEAILLDTSPIALTLLNIRGFLRVLDSPALPKIDLSAAFIVVQGNFSIGTPQQHYRQRIKITLTPNPNNRADYLFTENLPAEPAFPRNLGHKAFAVVGGQVDFHGMPGGSSTPAWTKLTATAQQNDLVITVQDDVSAWPQDAFVVVTSTDYFPDQAEVVGIIDVVALPSGGSKIFLEKPLRLMHFGDPKGVPDGYGGFVDQRAEVALLDRTIAITGTDEPVPYHREGGHFMIFMSGTPQFIEGVEFAQMGQQGKLGRYNIHFHVCGDDGGAAWCGRTSCMTASSAVWWCTRPSISRSKKMWRTTRGGTASWWRRGARPTTPSCATSASGLVQWRCSSRCQQPTPPRRRRRTTPRPRFGSPTPTTTSLGTSLLALRTR